MLKMIWITTSFIGFHRWLQAPDEVAFLRDFHRHVFRVKVGIRITDNRGVEFFMLQKQVNTVLLNWRGMYFEFSCEELAEKLALILQDKGYTVHFVEVSEDGECAGCVFAEDDE